jgi:hypothetical protein
LINHFLISYYYVDGVTEEGWREMTVWELYKNLKIYEALLKSCKLTIRFVEYFKKMYAKDMWEDKQIYDVTDKEILDYSFKEMNYFKLYWSWLIKCLNGEQVDQKAESYKVYAWFNDDLKNRNKNMKDVNDIQK